jgi:uncharacterized tellurite resistance protein B-like protein
MSLWSWLGLREPSQDKSSDIETLRRITASLDRIEPERARYLACFAFVLSRVANADLDISEVETREMERRVREVGGLPEEQAVLVVEIAKVQNRLFGGIDNYRVTKEFRALAAVEDRLGLLECLFAVAAADDSISGVEDAEIRKISAELGLSHDDFIAARSGFKSKLSVMKSLP